MKVARGRTENAKARRATGTFTGTVLQDPTLSDQPTVNINDVLFEPGARTYWHSHPGGQILQIKSGEGHVATHDESVKVKAGDVVFADPGEVHWHGAGAETYLLHTAISLGTTDWGAEVSAAEYDSASK